ncbi:MAG: carboxypeptidase-like regulatory domain-containing protein, partial [Candidatus Marinimicrobia bacterium]|nr:carboxypeptidase-like regulatory domain-containing protein [Candidatus Neomarinimicrobiota bacterium]
MKRHFKILLISCFLPVLLLAREEATVIGTISDKESGSPLIAVNIYLKDTVIGTMTNDEGCFIITDIPPGNYELIASMIGYEKIVRILRLSPGERLQLDILMKQTVLDYGKNVMVTASRTQKYIEEIPGSVDLISQEVLLNRNPQDRGEALR